MFDIVAIAAHNLVCMLAKYLFSFLFCLVCEYTVMLFLVIVLRSLRPLDAPS